MERQYQCHLRVCCLIRYAVHFQLRRNFPSMKGGWNGRKVVKVHPITDACRRRPFEDIHLLLQCSSSFYRSRSIADEVRHPCSSHHKANREANFGVRQCPRPPRPSPATHLQGRCLLYTRGSSICCGRTGYELGAGSYQPTTTNADAQKNCHSDPEFKIKF